MDNTPILNNKKIDNSMNKYFAYYISKNTPKLIENIKYLLISKFGTHIGNKYFQLITHNINYGDCDFTNTKKINEHTNSLVLIKFSNVKDLFIKYNSNIIHKKKETNLQNDNLLYFSKIISNNKFYLDVDNDNNNIDDSSDDNSANSIENDSDDNSVNRIENDCDDINRNNESTKNKKNKNHYNFMMVNSDPIYCNRITKSWGGFSSEIACAFSGTSNILYKQTREHNYILMESIIIPLKDILKHFPVSFDTKFNMNTFNMNTFNKELTNHINNNNLDDEKIIKILKVVNMIFENTDMLDIKIDYHTCKNYIPYIFENNNDIIELWELLMNNDYDNLDFLNNYNKLVKNQIIIEKTKNIKSEYSISDYNIENDKWETINKTQINKTQINKTQINKTIIYNIKCQLAAKICITVKSFNSLTYYDALPLSSYFITNQKIENNYPEDYNRQYITTSKNVNEHFQNHLIMHTDLGIKLLTGTEIIFINNFLLIRLMNNLKFSNNINKHYYINNIKFQYNYNFEKKSNTYDIINLYVNKKLLKNIYNNNIPVDFNFITRFFKITMTNKFSIENYKIKNYEYDGSITIPEELNNSYIIKNFNNFLKQYLDIELLEHQKNNVLWMLKIENMVDNNKLYIKSVYNNYTISDLDYKNISDGYLDKLKFNNINALTKNFNLLTDSGLYTIDFKENVDYYYLLRVINIYQNGFTNKKINGNCNIYDIFNNNNYDVINKIIPADTYNTIKSTNVELCGGILCDEVGLGKTLSIVTSLIVKMKNDMLKYHKYKLLMNELLLQFQKDNTQNIDNSNEKFIDPIDSGFEYNNLIIVPSRLTSQWANEIEKYVQNKFKLRVKVLASISNIKTLEKELHNFYNPNTPVNTPVNTPNKTSKSNNIINSNIKTISDNQSENVNLKILLENAEITMKTNTGTNTETNTETNTKINPNITKKTKEQKTIEKLMSNAKKQASKKNKNSNNKSGIITESESKSNITFNDILNPVNLIGKEPKIRKYTKKPKETNINDTINNNIDVDSGKDIDVDSGKDIDVDSGKDIDNNMSSNPDNETEYNFINNYMMCNETGDDYYKDQLYDIYIVSINLLNNDNYLDYLNHYDKNHLRPYNDSINDNYIEYNKTKIKEYYDCYNHCRKICRVSNTFNIFKIKWNRIILDEAHEKLAPIIKQLPTSVNRFRNRTHVIKYNDQFLYENLARLNANYKWAITGTPTQYGIDNIFGILQFLTHHNRLESHQKMIENIRYFSNLIGITPPDLDSLFKIIVKKTLKKNVKSQLNIPLFSEEIIYVTQNNIERNIYNTIRASQHFSKAIKIKRLFLMCTNILINEGYDLNSDNDISAEIVSLEQLNTNMISQFTKQLKQFQMQETNIRQQLDSLNNKLNELIKALEYFKSLELEKIIPPKLFKEISIYFNDNIKIVNKTNVINLNVIYNIIDIFLGFKEPESINTILLSNLISIKQEIGNIWKKSWENTDILNQIGMCGTSYGLNNCNDDINKINCKMDTVQNDIKRINNQIALFSNNEFLKEKTNDPCIICFMDFVPDSQVVCTPCRHVFCIDCIKHLSRKLKKSFDCPECRTNIECNTLNIIKMSMIINSNINPNAGNESQTITENNKPISENTIPKEMEFIENTLGKEWKNNCINKYGSKMAMLIEYLYKVFKNPVNRVIIFSQYDKMLKMIGQTLEEYKIKYVYCHGNNNILNKNINKFKKDETIRVIMLSSETSNSGSNLTEANHIIFIDVLHQHIEQVKAIETQAIGRAVRLGQKLPVKIIRFITQETIEETHFNKNRYDINILQE